MNLAQQCDQWDRDMRDWRVDGGVGDCPAKPRGYDLFRQGEDPLRLADLLRIPCAGQRLVHTEWTSTAKPVPLDSPPLSQQDLPL